MWMWNDSYTSLPCCACTAVSLHKLHICTLYMYLPCVRMANGERQTQWYAAERSTETRHWPNKCQYLLLVRSVTIRPKHILHNTSGREKKTHTDIHKTVSLLLQLQYNSRSSFSVFVVAPKIAESAFCWRVHCTIANRCTMSGAVSRVSSALHILLQSQ